MTLNGHFKNFNSDRLYSSNYVRAIQTAKYLSDKNNLMINIISNLGERKFGVSSWDELPEDFGRRQFLDDNYNADKTAKTAGMKVCGVFDNSSYEYADDIKSVADHYIYDFSELPDI